MRLFVKSCWCFFLFKAFGGIIQSWMSIRSLKKTISIKKYIFLPENQTYKSEGLFNSQRTEIDVFFKVCNLSVQYLLQMLLLPLTMNENKCSFLFYYFILGMYTRNFWEDVQPRVQPSVTKEVSYQTRISNARSWNITLWFQSDQTFYFANVT